MFTERGSCDRVVEFCMEDVEETEGGRVECDFAFSGC